MADVRHREWIGEMVAVPGTLVIQNERRLPRRSWTIRPITINSSLMMVVECNDDEASAHIFQHSISDLLIPPVQVRRSSSLMST